MSGRLLNARRLGFVVGAAVALALVPGATAQTPGENLGGYRARAAAQAFSLRPVFPGLLPTDEAPFEVTLALSTASASSGGNAFGQASLVWPGSALANLGPIIGTGAGQPFVASLVPPYPLVAEASPTEGETVKGAPPAMIMRARAAESGSDGEVRLLDVELPGLLRIDELVSQGDVAVSDVDVQTRSRVTLKGVSLLDGAITAEVIRSISRTSSDGETSTSDGDVDVVGLRIGGIDVSVTAEGVKIEGGPEQASEMPGAGEEPFPGQSPEERVNAVLEAAEAHVRLTRTGGRSEGGAADRVSTGLLVSIANPLGGSGLPGLGNPGRFDVLLASTASTTLATPPFDAELPDFVASESDAGFTSPGATGGLGDVVTSGGGSFGSGAVPSPAATGEDVGVGAGAAVPASPGEPPRFEPAVRRTDYAFGGVPISVLLGMLAATGVGARYVIRFMTRIIATGE